MVQQSSVGYLQKQNKQIVDFQKEYETMKKEISQLHRLAEETQSKAAQNLAEYRTEQDYIHKTFQNLKDNVVDMTGSVVNMTEQQKVVHKRAEQINKDLLIEYSEINAKLTDANDTLQKVVTEIPATIKQAKTELTNEMQSIISNERQRRQIEQNYFNQVIKTITEKLELTNQ